MKTIKKWFGKRGFKSIGLIAGAVGPFLLLGFSDVSWFASGACSALFVYINWQPLKDLSDVDEKVVEGTKEVKEFIDEKIEDLKKQIIGLKK